MMENEHIKHFGENYPDNTFYVIRRKPLGAGLLSNVNWVLSHVNYAVLKGYIPVVNMKDYKTLYNENVPIKIGAGETSNAWEYFFEQPCGYSLENIKNAKNVILGSSENHYIDELPNPIDENEDISKYYDLISKYCKFNFETISEIESKKRRFFGKNILGVLYRGTDYKTAKEHYTPPSIELMIQKTRDVFQQEKFDHIFICTEDQSAVNEFCKVFTKERIIVSESKRLKEYHTGRVPEIILKNSSSAYKAGLDYLTDIYLLSQCDGIVACKCNGTSFALALNNNKYRFSYFFDLGVNS
jgi:hypothetical protein